MNYQTRPDPRRVQQRSTEPAPGAIGPMLGLTDVERERGSISGFVRAVVTDNVPELHYFQELTQQTEKATGRSATGYPSYYAPGDVTIGRRDMTKATASAGGYLVGAGIGGFSHSLDNASVLSKLPVTKLPNLTGDVTITRESVKGTAGWLSTEGTTMPDGQAVYGQLAMTPKTVAATVTLSRQLVLQTALGPQIERALAVTLGEAVDRALVAGSGASGEPTGLANLVGIDTRTGASFTHAMSAAMFKVANGWAASDDSIAWIAGVDAVEDLQTRERATGSGFIADGGRVLERPLYGSRSVGAQVLVCAPWPLIWMASWGGLEINVDPMTHFKTGKVIVRALWTLDFGCERPESVAIATAVS